VLRFGPRPVQTGREENAAAATGGNGTPHDRLRGCDRGPDVEMEDAVEIGARQFEKRRFGKRAYVVHQHVDAAECVPRGTHQPFDFGILRQICRQVRSLRLVPQNRL